MDKEKGIIFIDVDGVILDISQKYFNLYKDLLESKNRKYIEFNKYWKLKVETNDNNLILSKTQSDDLTDWFNTQFIKKIELKKYLKFDKLITDIIKTMQNLAIKYNLVIMTGRKHQRNLRQQLNSLQITPLADEVVITSDKNLGILSFIDKPGIDDLSNVWLVADTEGDLKKGKAAGIKTIGILTGLRNRQKLEEFQPDLIIEKFADLESYLI